MRKHISTPKARSKQCLRAVVSWPSSFKPKWWPSCGNTTKTHNVHGVEMIGNDLTRWHPCVQFWFTQFKGLGLAWARMDNTIVQIYLLNDSEIGTTLLVGVLEDLTETGRVSQIGWFGCSSSMSWQLMLFLPGGPRQKHVDSPASRPTGPSSSWALSARGLDNAVWKGVNDNALTV